MELFMTSRGNKITVSAHFDGHNEPVASGNVLTIKDGKLYRCGGVNPVVFEDSYITGDRGRIKLAGRD